MVGSRFFSGCPSYAKIQLKMFDNSLSWQISKLTDINAVFIFLGRADQREEGKKAEVQDLFLPKSIIHNNNSFFDLFYISSISYLFGHTNKTLIEYFNELNIQRLIRFPNRLTLKINNL